MCVRVLAARLARGLHIISPSCDAEGAGKAGCRLHPWVPCKKSTGVGPQVQPETSGLPCAMVYGLFRALPGDRAFFFATVAPEKPASRGLCASIGAPGPHVFAVRVRHARQSLPLRPSHVPATLVTIATRPSSG